MIKVHDKKCYVLNSLIMNGLPVVQYEDLGNISYENALLYQKDLQSEIIAAKRSGKVPTSVLLLCQHNHVYTLGKSGSMDNLKYDESQLQSKGIEFHHTNRGGDITYHGPGQITGYPIFDMDQFYNDLHRYVRDLEEVIIRVLAEVGLKGIRIQGYTGVWLPKTMKNPLERKICAIGVHMSRWVTLHGFALNVNTDISKFDGIIACGIQEEGMAITSIQKELGSAFDMGEVKALVVDQFAEVFGFRYLLG